MLKDSALLPLDIVKMYSRKYPGIWEKCDMLTQIEDVQWDRRRCLLPISAGIAIMQNYIMPLDGLYMVPALYSWRKYKEVYTFDNDLAEILYQQSGDIKIPSNVIMEIPFPCVFISSEKYKFFAHLENDVNDGRWELRFARIMDDGTTRAYFLHLGEFTIEESLASVLKEGDRVKNDVISQDNNVAEIVSQNVCNVNYTDTLNSIAISEMLQLLLYICSSNADVNQHEENKKTYRKTEGSKITDKYREVRKWDTGFYVGRKIHSQLNTGSNSSHNSHGNGSKKRTHIRRGHWHHFWSGAGENKHLKLHWIFPLIVNGGDDEAPVRIIEEK